MIDIKQYNLLIKVMKAMKCDVYIIYPNKIVGSDMNCVTCTEAFLNTGIETDYIEINKEILKTIVDTVKNYIDNHTKEEVEKASFNALFNHLGIKRIDSSPLMMTYNKLTMDKTILLERGGGNLRNDKAFEECLSLKAKDGMKFYEYKGYHRKYLMSIFTGLLPINKNDKVYIEIYMELFSTSFMVKFVIDKGFIQINKYIKYLNI